MGEKGRGPLRPIVAIRGSQGCCGSEEKKEAENGNRGERSEDGDLRKKPHGERKKKGEKIHLCRENSSLRERLTKEVFFADEEEGKRGPGK